MENRRRSPRQPVALSVWIKDARGGERTETVDVSAHGIAVLSDEVRPVRGYVELEIALPDSEVVIAVTAMVARCSPAVDPTTGARRLATGLDFFLFDAKSKKQWQSFLRSSVPISLLREWSSAVESPDRVEEGQPAGDVPAFLVRPRNIDRLWAFYRGELARAQVRIETAIAKPPGTVLELLVVHPQSHAEWVLDGEVLSVLPPRQGERVMLEIGLPGLDQALMEAFRTFVVTGRGQIQEEVVFSSELPLDAVPDRSLHEGSKRIESIVIDFQTLGESDFEPDDLDDEDPTELGDHPVVHHLRELEPVPLRPPAAKVKAPPAFHDYAKPVFAAFFEEAAAAKAARVGVAHPHRPLALTPSSSSVMESAPLPKAPPPLPNDSTPQPNFDLPWTDLWSDVLIDAPTRQVAHVDRSVGLQLEPLSRAAAVGDPRPGLPLVISRPAPRPRPSSAPPPLRRARSAPPPPPGARSAAGPAQLERDIAIARARVFSRPHSVNAMLELSRLLSDRGDRQMVEEAIDLVRRVTAQSPRNAIAHHRLAELLARKGDYRQAREHISQAQRLGHDVDPDLQRVVADGIVAG